MMVLRATAIAIALLGSSAEIAGRETNLRRHVSLDPDKLSTQQQSKLPCDGDRRWFTLTLEGGGSFTFACPCVNDSKATCERVFRFDQDLLVDCKRGCEGGLKAA
ncbi:hypothetical protein ACHAWF_009674 [Thalassiosira exigua]